MKEEMRKCKYCNKSYPLSDFGVALTTPQKVYKRHKCRFCYQKTKKALLQNYRAWIIDYKQKHKCKKCGCSDFRVLEFHHQDENKKEFSLGSIYSNKKGLKKIKEEVTKCIVLCANCHRILHHEQKNKRGVV